MAMCRSARSAAAPVCRCTSINGAAAAAVAKGWLWLHESGTYVKFTPAGAELFA
jgi:hypothetical protein